MKTLFLSQTAAALLLAAIGTHTAQAQTTPAPRLVTRDELRTCMNGEDELAKRKQAIEVLAKANRDETAAIRTEAAELKAEGEKLEEDQKPMDRFERKVRTHNNRVKASQAAAASFNNELDTLNKSVVSYNQKCGGISFLPEDKEAILKERGAGKN